MFEGYIQREYSEKSEISYRYKAEAEAEGFYKPDDHVNVHLRVGIYSNTLSYMSLYIA